MAVTTWYERQLTSGNYLSPIGFVLILEKAKKASYLCQKASIPTFTVGSADVNYRGFVPLPVVGNAVFEELTIEFIVDENLENYMEIHNWMRSISAAITSDDAYQWKKNYKEESRPDVSAATLQVLNNNNNNNFDVRFFDMFPISLSAVPFDVTGIDNEFFTASATFKYSYYEIRKVNSADRL